MFKKRVEMKNKLNFVHLPVTVFLSDFIGRRDSDLTCSLLIDG